MFSTRTLERDTENKKKTYIGGSHGGQLSVSVVSRRNFDDVRRDDEQSVETSDDSPQLASRPT